MTRLSIIVLTFNEQGSIIKTLDKAKRLGFGLNNSFDDFEIIVTDGGSSDNTRSLLESWGASNKQVRYSFICPKESSPIGASFKAGLDRAVGEYVTIIAGDNEEDENALRKLYSHIGKADVILTYPSNPEIRSLDRNLLSRTFILGMNLVFFLNLKYYTGTNIFRTDQIKRLTFPYSFLYMPAIVVKSIKQQKCSHMEVGTAKLKGGRTKMFKLSNVLGCFFDTLGLIRDVYILRK